ncbi:type II secretion system protein E (GspE) [Alkalithermobacter thermoalcaliphilus JW-YL-7 = DSM 7308]|uniref:Type II secretion system protein E n=1 Tax=Alkalithermobacter thermoalcaliphilus JW-YL-7 = DSM 7308 TaxID=1121328 RepID=A0A150FT89_CLOPD|nr:type II secretion system protein E [[Clostridium] paradoxum JW-YL-7 = DSM 7308]KXZ40798.1 type II secretion system protein E [[Clostridium] paradoxum JW-YL-7 = DSM 7308]SHL36922.1 type II secretion system protein E (GspE) [[Clostridium] paradoxum JW-YL-7 = DSM 7308]
MKNNKFKLGDMLVSVGKITNNQLQEALKEQRISGKKLGEILVEKGFVDELQIIEILEFQLGIPHIDLNKYYIDPNTVKLIPEYLARKHILIPISKKNGKLTVAMADPLNIFAIDDIRIYSGFDIEPVISTKASILKTIDIYYGKEIAQKAVEDFKKEQTKNINNEIKSDSLENVNTAPIVRLVNSIFEEAVNIGASDIHIEPFENNVRIRYRVDGSLIEGMNLIKETHLSLVNRIKIMGKMNIAEKRIPQDGRIEININDKPLDLRISIIPTVFGEKVVIRLLVRNGFFFSRNDLGLIDENIERFDKVVKNPSGIILITGPTGSGKTTTLYTLLKELNSIDKNIISIEDPVEYKIEGINQIQINNKAGLTFANGLRSILRQDPDIIMVGEIRDKETAQISIRAATTGHLVISTMHTNDAPSTISRLLDMEIEPYLISSSLVGVVAQRLVRKICPECIQHYTPSIEEMKILNINEDTKLYKGKGCLNCSNTGYKGRRAIHEIMIIDKESKSMINSKFNLEDLREHALKNGMISLKENCKKLVLSGVTTFDEMIKATYTYE